MRGSALHSKTFLPVGSCLGPILPSPLQGAQSMAQARTHRDQGSLSSLVYSFFPAPASCQAPVPTVGLPSPCTVSSLPALLPAASLAPWPLYPCTSGNLPEHLPKLFLPSAFLHPSQPSCTSSNLPNYLHLKPGLHPPPLNFHCLVPSSPIPFFLLSFIISPSLSICSTPVLFLPHLPLSIFSSSKDPLLHPAATIYSAKTPALRSGWGRAACQERTL